MFAVRTTYVYVHLLCSVWFSNTVATPRSGGACLCGEGGREGGGYGEFFISGGCYFKSNMTMWQQDYHAVSVLILLSSTNSAIHKCGSTIGLDYSVLATEWFQGTYQSAWEGWVGWYVDFYNMHSRALSLSSYVWHVYVCSCGLSTGVCCVPCRVCAVCFLLSPLLLHSWTCGSSWALMNLLKSIRDGEGVS